MKGEFEKRMLNVKEELQKYWNKPIQKFDTQIIVDVNHALDEDLKVIDEARKDLPEIIIRFDGVVILRDADYDHDIILGQMNMEAYKNVEEARKSLKKFDNWFGDENKVGEERE